jgi:flavin reductase (DIM6/NTAB) family NADH-FMN oxidoreductase RutF
MKVFSSADLDNMSRFFRANLVNCLTGVKPALLIGTYSENGVGNLAVFSSVFHLGADPALIGHVQRPLTEFSHTYRNIISGGAYTLNHVPASYAAPIHHTSAKFADGESEFLRCGFREERAEGFAAPFVAESRLRIGMRFVREIFIPENDTRLIIGRVELVAVDESLIYGDGNIDLDGNVTTGAGGLETYYRHEAAGRFSYAKPDTVPVASTRK